MDYNIDNIIIDSVLSDEEIREIYDLVENAGDRYLVDVYAQNVSNFRLPESVRDKVIGHCERLYGLSDLEIAEYQFARYMISVDAKGETIFPNLSPHFDDTFPEPRITFDYQIGGNAEWPLVVEEREYSLRNNQALTFSGTHQIHWRKQISFNDDSQLDMVFFHLRSKSAEKIDPSHISQMKEKENKFRSDFGIIIK